MENLAAEIDKNGIVIRVIVVESPEKAVLLLGGEWVKTTQFNIEKNYAGIGYKYIKEKDNFCQEKPKDFKGKECESYILNDKCEWISIKPKPVNILKDNECFEWNEEKLKWEIIKITI